MDALRLQPTSFGPGIRNEELGDVVGAPVENAHRVQGDHLEGRRILRSFDCRLHFPGLIHQDQIRGATRIDPDRTDTRTYRTAE